MITLRHIVPALCLATSLAALAVYAASHRLRPRADAPMQPAAVAGRPRTSPAACLGEMGFVLHKLESDAEQKTQIKAIFAEQKSQFEALRASAKSNREALATTPPTDSRAMRRSSRRRRPTLRPRITLMSETWGKIYQSVLTPAHQQSNPGDRRRCAGGARVEDRRLEGRAPQPPGV